jgi:FMN phosphatase YigB (HAD superfamily)
MKESNAKLNIKNVLMDVDGTMTEEKKGRRANEVLPLELLVDLLVEKRSVSRTAALELINEAGDTAVSCLFDLLDKLNISKESYWNLMANELANVINIPDDTVYFIKDLKTKGIKLFSATTNSRMMTLLKLSIGGLASLEGSPFMAGFFSGNSFNDPQGKFSEKFFPLIMKTGKFNPSTTMMIGDEITRDLEPAQKAGIENIVIIDRKQPEPIVYRNKVIFVNSLRVVSGMI